MSIINRGGDPAKRAKANNDVADFGIIKAEYRAIKKKFDDADESYDNERSKLEQVQAELNNKLSKINAVEEEIDSDPLPDGAQPRERIHKRDKLKFEISQLNLALLTQSQTTSEASEKLRNIEKILFLADKKMSEYVDHLTNAKEALSIQTEIDGERAKRLAKLERNNAKRWEKKQKEAINIRADQVEEITRKAKEKISVTQTQQIYANEKLRASNLKTKEVVDKLIEEKNKHLLDRNEVVMELKTNLNFVQAELVSKSSKHRKKVEDARQELEREKNAMLSKGLNPYVEFRKRNFEKADKNLEKSLLDAVAQNKINLSERLLKEEEIYRKEESSYLKEKEYEKKYRDEQGNLVVQTRNQNYITSVTADHVEILDPAGRAARIDPSQITDIADYSYGLGKSSRIPSNSMKRITDKIRSSLNMEKNDYGEYKRLLSSLEKATNNLDVNKTLIGTNQMTETTGGSSPEKNTRIKEFGKLANPTGELVGANETITSINLQNVDENKELLQIVSEDVGEITLNDEEISVFSPKYKPVKQSKFEIDAFERAKARQRTFIEQGTVQIAGGWEFKGNSFVSKPAEIEFKDFEVGKVYKKRFSLTNTSYTFNSFKILALADSIIDFFEISYEKPGRMSAGVSCFVDIEFSPKINEDIFGMIPLSTGTGPVNIPLRCLIQRCAPRVQTEFVDFGDLVIGEKLYKSIKITNTQAISTSFRVSLKPKPIIKTPDELEAEAAAEAEAAKNAAIVSQYEEKLNIAKEAYTDAWNAFETAGKQKDKKIIAAAQAALDSAKLSSEEAEKELSAFLETLRLKEDENKADSLLDKPEEVSEADIEIGTSAAVNDGELMARVRNIITSCLRKKKKETPNVFSVVALDSLSNLSPHRVGVLVCDISPTGNIEPKTSSSEIYHIKGYSECVVAFLCSPLTLEPFDETFSFIFDAVPKRSDGTVDSLGNLITKEQCVRFTSSGIDLPIYLASEEIDLRCTLHDRLYRKRIEIRNRAKTAYRVNFLIPHKYSKFIEVTPPMLFVQGGMSQEVNLKFTPSVDILNKFAHFTRLHENFENSAVFAYPLEIQAVNQQLPVHCIIKTEFTSALLRISSQVLDFGKVFNFQRSMIPIQVTNTSMLPQKIASVKLKKEISVEPNEGFAILLPNETMTLNIYFSPSSELIYSIDLQILTSFNETYIIKINGEGVKAPIEFDSAVIDLRSTSPGEKVIESIFIKNTSSKPQSLEIMPPNKSFSWIKFSPTILKLDPGVTERVEIDFNPPAGLMAMDPSDWYMNTKEQYVNNDLDPFINVTKEERWTFFTGKYGGVQWMNNSCLVGIGRAGGNGGDGNGDNVDEENTTTDLDENGQLKASLDPSDWGVVGKWNIPIAINNSSKISDPAINNSSVLFFNINTVVNIPELEVDTTDIDFGQSAVGIRMTKMVKIRNNTNRTIHLVQIQLLNIAGPFTVLNFVREISPGAIVPLLFNCIPIAPSLSVEQLILSPVDKAGHEIRFTLKVQGVNPTVDIQGLTKALGNWGGAHGGILDFGNAVCMDVITKKINVTNKSDFAINMAIQRVLCEDLTNFQQSKVIPRTANGLPIFSFRPEISRIDPGQILEIEFCYRPDRGREEPFREDLTISVGQSDGLINVCLVGRAFARQVFITPTDPLDEPFFKNKKALPDKLEQISEKEAFPILSSGVIEDIYGNNSSLDLRNLLKESRKLSGLEIEVKPPEIVKLEYPDPFAEGVDASTYIVIDPAAGGKGSAPAKGSAPLPSVVCRQQSKKLTVTCAKIFDGRPNSTNGGTYEVQLSPDAIASGLFKVLSDKGNVAVGSDIIVEIQCSLPTPKGIGGLVVGSWQNFNSSIVLKGGWKSEGSSDDMVIPFILSAYVRL